MSTDRTYSNNISHIDDAPLSTTGAMPVRLSDMSEPFRGDMRAWEPLDAPEFILKGSCVKYESPYRTPEVLASVSERSYPRPFL